MSSDRRRLMLALLLAASAALVAWDRLRAAPADEDLASDRTRAVLAAPSPPASTSAGEALAPPDRSAVGTPASPEAIGRLRGREDYQAALARTAPPPPVAMSAAAAVADAPAAPPPPPPWPWRVIGKGRVEGTWEVYVAREDHVEVLRAGDLLEGRWHVLAIAPPTLRLAASAGGGAPDETRTMTIGEAFEP